MTLYYLHEDTDGGDSLEIFLTEEELRTRQIELMEEYRDGDGDKPDYDDEDEFGEAWSDYCENKTLGQDYYFTGSVEVPGIMPTTCRDELVAALTHFIKDAEYLGLNNATGGLASAINEGLAAIIKATP